MPVQHKCRYLCWYRYKAGPNLALCGSSSVAGPLWVCQPVQPRLQRGSAASCPLPFSPTQNLRPPKEETE